MAITTIQIDTEIKKALDKLKIHHRESYNELMARLISGSSPKEASRESLLATIEVLSDPKAMRAIAESIEETQKGNFGTPLEELEKELGV